MEGVSGGVSEWAADECNGALSQELLSEEEEQHNEIAHAVKPKELDAWGKFDVFGPRRQGKVSKQIAQT